MLSGLFGIISHVRLIHWSPRIKTQDVNMSIYGAFKLYLAGIFEDVKTICSFKYSWHLLSLGNR